MALTPMKIIKERLAAKEEQLRIVQAEIDLLRSMLAEANGDPDPAAPKTRAPRANVKQLLLTLLEKTGAAGLNAAIAVEMAEAMGHKLERASASSILSRLKSEGAIVYDGERYKLTKFGWNDKVHPLPGIPASKGAFG